MIRVKICGLTSLADAHLAAAAGADLLGFIFHRPSPRYVTPEVVRAIVAGLKADWTEALCVGVFVDEPASQVREVLDFCALDAAQLHGSEPPETIALFPGQAYKAIRPRSPAEAQAALDRYGRDGPDGSLPELLLDSFDPRQPGGTGQVGDWGLAAGVAAQRHILLAGGLSPHNVAGAVRAVRPWGVDVSSGVESAPGRKSPDALRAFIGNARRALDECDMVTTDKH